MVRSRPTPIVTPAQAGVHNRWRWLGIMDVASMDSRLRGNDDGGGHREPHTRFPPPAQLSIQRR
ncbi:hypothetical protein CA237_15030 [Sphingomonas sp. ABOLH]|nr:MAG: hypothetical protein DI625_04330 [Sphingomonas sp.]RSV22557.1 hypothetical protein CA237_15030 [Sphingomonas sp. ABOLH]